MSNFISLAKAAENSVVSCSGSDCTLCSLLETVSRVYNFFLAVSFAVAVLALVIAGVNYLINVTDRNKLQKSWYFLKSGVGGFALIIVGWLVIQTAIWAAGYPNAGSWWGFECGDETGVETHGNASLQSGYYDNLKTFPDLATYFASGEKEAKITGPLTADSLLQQLKALPEGEMLHFLAPAGVNGSGGMEKLYLPLLTAMKEGGNLNLESTGEYLNMIQGEWARLKTQLGDDSPTVKLLDKYLAVDVDNGDQYLMDGNGDILDLDNDQDFNSLYNSLAQILKENEADGDRTSPGLSAAAAGNSSLSKLLAILAGSDGSSPEQTEKILGILAAESLKLTNILMVDREVSGDVLSTSKLRCENSGGKWTDNNSCQCPEDYLLQGNGLCQPVKLLEENCVSSGGSWQRVSVGFAPPALCGERTGAWGDLVFDVNSEAERANISEIVPDRFYCKCESGDCIDGLGSCFSDIGDDDGDKIGNTADHCPNTPAADKNQVNKVKGNQFYGCGCNEIGEIPKVCPPDQCVGDNWVDYPSGENQICKNGRLLTFSCQPREKMFDAACAKKNQLAGGAGGTGGTGSDAEPGNTNDNSWYTGAGTWSQSQPPYNASSNNNTNDKYKKSSSISKKSKAKPPTSKAPGGQPPDDYSKPPSGVDKLPPGEGNPGGGPRGNGTSQAIKDAMKRVSEKDWLRYEMIFMYTRRVDNLGMMGGMSNGCSGTVWVNYSLPRDAMEVVLVHEITHAGHNCNTGWGWGSASTAERLAVANSIGSVCRVQGDQEMPEFPMQKEGVTYMGKEARGYISRKLTKVNPQGHLGTAAYRWPIGYAFSYGDRTRGPYHYGDHDSNLILGLKENEEKVEKMIMEEHRKKVVAGEVKCFSKPPKDMPPVEICDKEGVPEHVFK